MPSLTRASTVLLVIALAASVTDWTLTCLRGNR
jgi:hypothetical protein